MATTTLSALNRVQYLGLNFDTSFDEVLTRIQVQFAADFNDFALSSLGIVLLDAQAFGLDTLNFYLDRRATETYLQTARTRSAVSRLARQLGYKMTAAVAASVDLTITLTDFQFLPADLPKGTQFIGPNNLIFETSRLIVGGGTATSSPFSAPLYEGETVTEHFVSNGLPNQVFQLSRVPTGKTVASGSVRTTVAGQPFQEVDFLTYTQTLDSTSLDPAVDPQDQFEVDANSDPPTVRFGNGVAGIIPAVGAAIDVVYVATSGAKGLVSTNTITRIRTPFVYVSQAVRMTMTNPSPSVGGSDQEDLSSAKSLAPQVFKSRKIAVTREDYIALSSAFADPFAGRVAVSQAMSSRSAATDLETQTQLGIINTAASSPEAVITAADAAIATSLGTITTEVANIDDQNTGTDGISDQAGTITSLSASTRAIADNTNNQLTQATAQLGVTASFVTSLEGLFPSSRDLPRLAAESLMFGSSGGSLTVQRTSLSSWATNGVTVGMFLKITNCNDTDLNITAQITAISTNGQTLTLSASDTLGSGVEANAAASVDIPENDKISGSSKATLLLDTGGITTAVNAAGSSVTAASGGVDTMTTGLAGIDSAVELINDSVSSITTSTTSITTETTNIENQMVLVVDSIDGMVETIEDATAALFNHIDQLLAADCKANLISVPILTKDATGFYAAPSTSLIQALQDYLNARKEVTQTVKVTSGEPFLVYAVIEIRCLLNRGFSLETTVAAVRAAIDSVLRDRKFGAWLYQSELEDSLDGIEGFVSKNVEIKGHRTVSTTPSSLSSTRLDPTDANIRSKNLRIEKGEIITKAPDITPTPAPTDPTYPSFFGVYVQISYYNPTAV